MFCVGWRYSLQVPSAHGPFPMRSSAPKFERRNINRPKMREFLAIHGVMQTTNTSDASATPASEGLLRFQRRYPHHTPEAGRNASMEVLVSPAIPHNSPNLSHGFNPLRSSRSRVSQKISARSSAARLVSQTHRVHQYMTGGITAHSQAVQIANFSSKHRLAIRKIGMQVSAEKKLLRPSRTTAAACV